MPGLRSKFYVSLSKDEVSGVFWMSFITFKFDYNRQKEKRQMWEKYGLK